MSWLDYLIIASYCLAVLMIGRWYQQRNRTADDFFLGGRRMGPLPVAASLFVSWFSVISYTAIPGEVAANGPGVYVGLLAAPFALWFVGWKVIPRLRFSQTVSAYKIIEKKFGVFLGRFASALFLAMRVAWMAMIVHIASSVILSPIVFGRSNRATTWTLAVIMVGLTDCIQAAVMFGGAVAVILIAGKEVVWNGQNAPFHVDWPVLKFCDPWARASVVTAIVGSLSLGICVKTDDQMNAQRFLAVADSRQARQVLFGGFALDCLLTGLLACVGVCCLMAHGSSPVSVADDLFPRIVGAGLPVGVSGLIVAALLSAAMSSLSSGINSCVSTVASDWFQPMIARRSSQGITILATVGLGIIIFILSQIIGVIEGNLFELCYKVVNLLATPLGGLMLTALFIPRARVRMVWLGCFLCLAVVVYVTYFSGITFLLASPLGLAVQLTAAWAGRK
ncbi:hypothetical protein LCGC14_0326210 [marine sediment metagenome]|uniref:Sodium:solute symporter n=1 Tax=marine sediment metagenome TaxID=412755 RepID=A0A0F9THY9_9ZZZZ